MGSERRNFARVSWGGLAVAQMDGHTITCRGVDLSTTGVMLESSWYAYPNRAVDLRLVIEGRMVTLRGRVKWSRKADVGFRCGVEFTVGHADCRRQVDSFVTERLRQSQVEPPPGVPHYIAHDCTQRIDTCMFTVPVVAPRPELANVFAYCGVPAYVPRDATEPCYPPMPISDRASRGVDPAVEVTEPMDVQPAAFRSSPVEETLRVSRPVRTGALPVEPSQGFETASTRRISRPAAIAPSLPEDRADAIAPAVPEAVPEAVPADRADARRDRIEQLLATVPRRRPDAPRRAARAPERVASATRPPRSRRPESSGLLRLYRAALTELQ